MVGERRAPLVVVRHPRTRRYLLRVLPNGSVRLTIPRRGCVTEALSFAERNGLWLERQFQRLAARPASRREWWAGAEILFRGEPVKIEILPGERAGLVRFGDQMIEVPSLAGDLRPFIESHLRRLASQELPPRVIGHAVAHGLTIHRVTVRNQRSRWGSCSRRRCISLNWRLIHAPLYVCDYIILHELMHLREMNHSARFWREVERVCPDYKAAERWLKQAAALLA